MKKFAIFITVIIILIVAAAAGAAFTYSRSDAYADDTFPASTSINGVDCSGMTYAEAAQTLADDWNSRTFVVTGPLNDELASYTNLDFTYDAYDSLAELKEKNIVLAAANHFIHTSFAVTMPMVIDEYSEEFKEEVISSDFLHSDHFVETADAYVDTSDPDFPIIPEVYGTQPDGERFFTDLIEHIELGEPVLIFEEANYYLLPAVTSDDPELKEWQEYCRKYLTQRITYELGEETFTVPAEDLDEMLADIENHIADEEAVAAYVAQLAEEYDNTGIERNFTSIAGKEITVSGGIYGWEIAQKEETAQLIEDINSGKDVSRAPKWYVHGYGEYSRELGDTYFDVDVTEQKVRLYIDGETVFTSDCVTGCRATGTTTEIGTFKILNKLRNVVLRGDNADGTEYESPVSYWLGINWVGEGFHDASWRNSFGGNIWKYDGSHGCINMPPSRMPELYNLAEVGMPVVVHY